MPTATRRLSVLLLILVLAIAGIDLAWASLAHFDLDLRAYAVLAVIAAALAGGAAYYGAVREEPGLSAMLAGTGFLCAFSAGFSAQTYFLLTVSGPRIDGLLAASDRAMGISWPHLMGWAAAHPAIDALLGIAYASMLPQVAMTIVVLGCLDRGRAIYGFCIAVAAGAIITAAIWTAFPSFGAFSVYALPQAVTAHLNVALDQHYAQDLLALLAHGPGRIAPEEVKGLIGFPSYHAVLALLVTWHVRDIAWLRWPAVLLNLLVLLSTPIQGGHHVVDVIAGFAVAAAAIAIARAVVGMAEGASLAEDAAAPAQAADAALAPNL